MWDAGEQGLKFGDAACFTKSLESAALRGPVTIAQVRGVASPDHEFWLFAKNTGKNTITSAENLVRWLEAIFGDIVCAADGNAQVGGRGAANIVGRCL